MLLIKIDLNRFGSSTQRSLHTAVEVSRKAHCYVQYVKMLEVTKIVYHTTPWLQVLQEQ